MAAAAAPVALFRVAHARLLSYATRGHLHLHWLPVDDGAVQLFDRLVHVTGRLEMHEPVVPDDIALDHRAELFKQLADLRRLRVIGQIADEYFRCRCGGSLPALRRLTLDRLAVDHVAVQILYRIATLILVLHVHEPVILHDIAFHYFAVFLKKWPDIGDVRFLRQIPDEYFERARTAKTRHRYTVGESAA